MAESAPRPNRALLVKLAVAVGGLLVAAVLVARGLDLKALSAQVLASIRAAGPGWFFVAMAVLPTVGVPLSLFLLTAGSAFGADLGMALVTVLSLLAVTVNMAITYFLAQRAV